MKPFNRVILVVMDSVGVGALPDAKKFNDPKWVNTLGNISKTVGGLNLPNMQKLGFGTLTKVQGVSPQKPKNGFATKCLEKSNGKDTSTGHWEMAGLVVKKPFAYYPEGFPQEMIDKFVKDNDLPGILCNAPASGTEIIKELGEESIRTGKPIVYTSSDSVFQIACHEDHFGLNKLYKISQNARSLCDDYGVVRVIARPFVGTNASDFKRTPNRKDYSIELPGKALFQYLEEKQVSSYAIGKIASIYNNEGIAKTVKSTDNDDGIDKLIEACKETPKGLIMINLVDFDQDYGHRRNPIGYAKALEQFDHRLPDLLDQVSDNDMIIFTADHGNDPTAPGTDHTREFVPFVSYSPRIRGMKKNQKISKCKSFTDIGATIYHALTGEKFHTGSSMLSKLELETPQDPSTFSAYKLIDKKKQHKNLTKAEISWFINEYLEKNISDAQMSAMLMAIYLNGFTPEETAFLTDTMLYSGKTFDFNDIKVIDKHSTGGVGDKTSFILAPIAAAAGVKVPMIAGRGLGFTGGTVDKAEAIPGFDAELPLEKFAKHVKEDGIVLMGQTKDIAPADKRIYALRDVTATIESVPLITASIMSKKLAEGSSGMVFDVKYGNGAFMKTRAQAAALAKSLTNTALRFDKNISIFLTTMSEPLGYAVGNSVEIIECIETLKGKGPKDLTNLCLELAGSMIHLAGITKSHSAGVKKAKEVLRNGKALACFSELIKRQGGNEKVINDYSLLPMAKLQTEIIAPKTAYLNSIATSEVGLECTLLGGGRQKSSDSIDHGVGIIVHKKRGQRVKKGESIATIYHHKEQQGMADQMVNRFLESHLKFSKEKPIIPTLINKHSVHWSTK